MPLSPSVDRVARTWWIWVRPASKNDDHVRRAASLLDGVGRDLRYALRGMRRTPAFTGIALATLALAIGANTAIFSVVDALLVRPLPYSDAGRLVTIDATRDYEGSPRPVEAGFQLDAAKRWQDALHVFEDVGLYADAIFELTMRDGSEMVNGARVSPSFFSTLRAFCDTVGILTYQEPIDQLSFESRSSTRSKSARLS